MQNPSALSWTCLDGTSDRQEPAICSFDDVELHRYVVASDPPQITGTKETRVSQTPTSWHCLTRIFDQLTQRAPMHDDDSSGEMSGQVSKVSALASLRRAEAFCG